MSETRLFFPSKEVFLVYRQPIDSCLAGNFVYNLKAESLGRIKARRSSRTVGHRTPPPAKTPPKKSDSQTARQSGSRTQDAPPAIRPAPQFFAESFSRHICPGSWLAVVFHDWYNGVRKTKGGAHIGYP